MQVLIFLNTQLYILLLPKFKSFPPNSVLNVSPFIDLGDLIPSAFIMATDMSVDPNLRHNRIGMLAISPTMIISDSKSSNGGLGTITDLGDGVIGALRDGKDVRALSHLIPETTLSFLNW